MLHPSQFDVNEAWISFQLNDAPISTEFDGGFDVMALMDAASCAILAADFVPVGAPELSRNSAQRLLDTGQAHKRPLPKTLYIPTAQPADPLAGEAQRRDITVKRVSDAQLSAFIDEARKDFKEYAAGGYTERKTTYSSPNQKDLR